MFMTVKEAAEKWSISDRRVRILCAEGKIPGAYQQGRAWKIPANAEKPADGRYKSAVSLLEIIDQKKAELDKCRPLTAGEVERLNEEFTVEYTYNSNAIEGNTLTLRETDMVLRGLTIDQKPLKDHMEAVGHKEAFVFKLNTTTLRCYLELLSLSNCIEILLHPSIQNQLHIGLWFVIDQKVQFAAVEPCFGELIFHGNTVDRELAAVGEDGLHAVSIEIKAAISEIHISVPPYRLRAYSAGHTPAASAGRSGPGSGPALRGRA